MTITTAIVLAAGKGTRMRHLTRDISKAMAVVAGKPLIGHVLDRLARGGVSRAVVNVHYKAEHLEAYLRNRDAGPEIIISDERDELLETGGGLVKARPLLGDDPIFVCNIDAIGPGYDTALTKLEARYDGEGARLLLARRELALGFGGAGDFTLEGDRPVRRGDALVAPYVYSGTQILRPNVLDGERLRKFSLNEIWNRLLAADDMRAEILDGIWMHVGDPEAVQTCEALITEAGYERL